MSPRVTPDLIAQRQALFERQAELSARIEAGRAGSNSIDTEVADLATVKADIARISSQIRGLRAQDANNTVMHDVSMLTKTTRLAIEALKNASLAQAFVSAAAQTLTADEFLAIQRRAEEIYDRRLGAALKHFEDTK